MKVSFIGAGKVGKAMAMYIKSKVDVLYFFDLNKEEAKAAANWIGCLTCQPDELVRSSDIIFITTSDNAIEKVAASLSAYDVNGKTFVHMSGALTSEELISLKLKGAKTCSMHPLQTFSDSKKAVEDLKAAYFSLEGDDDQLIAIVESLGNPYFRLSKNQKNKYHLSACVFSNYLVTLMNYGSRLLESIGIEEQDGLQAMKPLIEATLSNVMTKGSIDALTGPIQRGDTKTLEKHMTELNGVDLEAYQLLGKMTTEQLIMDKDKKDVLNTLWRSV